MNYRDYQQARDAAWRMLIDCKIDRLPVNINKICENLSVRVLSYADGQGIIERYNLCAHSNSTDGFLVMFGNQPVVFYNHRCTPARIRFTIAHELGHLTLGHVTNGQATVVNREPSPTDRSIETAANQFAARLLAPACILWGLQLHTPQQIAKQCNISIISAGFRAERMQILYKRKKFLVSPLERKVFEQFGNYLKE